MAARSSGLYRGKRPAQTDWETRAPPPQAPQKPAWEAGSDEGDSEEEETPEELQQASSEAFFDYLVELKTKGTLSAKQVGVLAHFAKGGGLYGKGASLAVISCFRDPRRPGDS